MNEGFGCLELQGKQCASDTDIQPTASDLTKINIPQGDEGGELDPHGADGNGEQRITELRSPIWLGIWSTLMKQLRSAARMIVMAPLYVVNLAFLPPARVMGAAFDAPV